MSLNKFAGQHLVVLEAVLLIRKPISDTSRWNACVNFICSNILSNDGAGSYYCTSAYSHPRHNNRTLAYPCVILDNRATKLWPAGKEDWSTGYGEDVIIARDAHSGREHRVTAELHLWRNYAININKAVLMSNEIATYTSPSGQIERRMNMAQPETPTTV